MFQTDNISSYQHFALFFFFTIEERCENKRVILYTSKYRIDFFMRCKISEQNLHIILQESSCTVSYTAAKEM